MKRTTYLYPVICGLLAALLVVNAHAKEGDQITEDAESEQIQMKLSAANPRYDIDCFKRNGKPECAISNGGGISYVRIGQGRK